MGCADLCTHAIELQEIHALCISDEVGRFNLYAGVLPQWLPHIFIIQPSDSKCCRQDDLHAIDP